MTIAATAMRTPHGVPLEMRRDEIVSRLSVHRTLGSMPRAELEWLADHGEMRRLVAGEVIGKPGTEANELIVLLTGRIVILQLRQGSRRKVAEWHTGDVTGLFPYSRMRTGMSEVVAELETDTLIVMRDQLMALTRDCPVITETLVHAMVDRARMFNSTDWQDEKMLSLGKLSAGLAHELNNPASAASRSATSLTDTITQLAAASRILESAHLSDEQLSRIEAFRAACGANAALLTPLGRADLEDEITDWLGAHALDSASAESLVDAGVSTALLDQLAAAIDGPALGAAIRWSAAYRTACSLSSDIQRATSRIYELVSAVKRFTYMDRASVAEPFDLTAGLRDTVMLLNAKARDKSAHVALEIADDVPRIPAFGAEINQVWSNLIDNALDAIDEGGSVTVRVRRDGGGDTVVVCVADNGAGIPEDIRPRIFDPFFTTKPVGSGTGLGLDIVRRVVEHHRGRIEVDSAPGRTEFTVVLPAASPSGAGDS